jgi:pimeloyl-ACP methyl ester carboxylesterase
MPDPYTIDVPDSAIDDLKQRLNLARFPDELDGAGWDLGAPLADIKRLTAYWRDEYDWRKSERKLNNLPNFHTSIHVQGFDPLSIHYLHSKSPIPTAIPLLYVHGWPGSFLEGTKILPLLSSGDGSSNPAFDVVVISLPNFGFSEAPSKRGFALNQYAECCHKLMLQLGYPQYVTQGGDWGYYITRTMALLYPEAVRATHINFDCGGGAPTFSEYPLLALEHSFRRYSEREVEGMRRTKWFMEEGSGYRAISATKPQTLAYALQDSPVGWLAWVYEKLVEWTDEYGWTDEEVCEWVCVHWFSRAGM